MGDSRRKIDGALKAKIALEALKGERTYAELGALFSVHPKMIQIWKKQLLEGIPSLFSGKAAQVAKSNDELSDELYKQIGQLKVELDWLKKKSALLR
jgi:transposase-like protein